ncbi:Fibroblast growth factor receptor [Operophtera brumata]|uniref:receptor protein-tyrosine kinase n=1 Tax=Operophtera brumata TaxID=104452 RepID=A0A0L7LFM2_OPEBR|nr:Fibroblast growth factor receptor [Operophtera brumata]
MGAKSNDDQLGRSAGFDYTEELKLICWFAFVPDDTYTVIGASTNERLRLVCGLMPRSQTPSVQWFKDGLALDGQSKRVAQQRQSLRIKGFRPKDADVDIDRPLPEILSQHQAVVALLENNTIDENDTAKRFPKNETDNKEEDPDDKYEKEHPIYGHVDNTKTKFSPKFKHPTKMFKMDMKPAGSSSRLRCAADGNPTPNITWYKNKSSPILRSYFQPSYGKWSMTLDELTKADNGNYTCVVCNELGCIEHTVVLLVQERLYAKPVLTKGAVNQTKLFGQTAEFSCEFLSDMHLAVYWMYFTRDEFVYNDTWVDENKESVVYFDSNKIMTSENVNDKPEQLTIYNVTKEDEGWYVCVALNTLGNTTAKGYLTVLESFPVSEALDHGRHSLLINILTAVLGAMFFVAAIIVVMVFKKLKREKIKKQLAIETARAVIVTHWTKKVVVEKPPMNGSPAITGEGLVSFV